MRTTILIVTVLILASLLSVIGLSPIEEARIEAALKIPKVKHTLRILCEHPSHSIKAAVKCLRKNGKVALRAGTEAVVIPADVTSTAETQVVEVLYGGKKEPAKVGETVQVVIKFDKQEVPMSKLERFNAKLLADWKIGPRVYKIYDRTVPFKDYLILERIDGPTFEKMFRRWENKIYQEGSKDTLTLQRKFLNMLIAYLGGVMQVWDKDHRFGDAHPGNVMMRPAPMEKCKRMQEEEGEGESAEFDVIGEGKKGKCIIWKKEHVVLVDPDLLLPWYFAGSRERVDLFQVFQFWSAIKDDLIHTFGDVDLAGRMNSIIGTIPEEMPAVDEQVMGGKILKKLEDLSIEYKPPPKEIGDLKKMSLMDDTHALGEPAQHQGSKQPKAAFLVPSKKI